MENKLRFVSEKNLKSLLTQLSKIVNDKVESVRKENKYTLKGFLPDTNHFPDYSDEFDYYVVDRTPYAFIDGKWTTNFDFRNDLTTDQEFLLLFDLVYLLKRQIEEGYYEKEQIDQKLFLLKQQISPIRWLQESDIEWVFETEVIEP